MEEVFNQQRTILNRQRTAHDRQGTALDGRRAIFSTGRERAALPFVLSCLGLMSVAALLAGLLPLQFSVLTVFLFAGPHNWMELRYFAASMPVGLGKSRNFFAVAIGGALILTAAYAALPRVAGMAAWTDGDWRTGVAAWNSLLVGWIALLARIRARQTSRRDWSWTVPVACLLLAVNWYAPLLFSLSFVYLHPLMALWFLDRQLRRSRPQWLKGYHLCLALLPVLILLLWTQLRGSASLAADGALATRITAHAGAGLLPGVSSHLLVSTHVFLEMTHYGVWLLALPILGMRSAPWRLKSIPLVRHRRGWPRLTRAVLVAGAFVVLLLWVAFLADYPATRDLYFTVAMMHVLAEVPFILRML
ncbi:MAG TPA: hypothetical protein VF723_05000 [Pyrinomonadaceae bacterium]|jgi:hypothetical protein